MKSILRKITAAGRKRRLSFAPDVKTTEEEAPPFPPPPPPPTLGMAPGGGPGPGSSQPGQVYVVQDDDFLGGVLSDDSWPMNVTPLLICAAVLLCLALVTILNYATAGASGTAVPKPDLPTGAAATTTKTCATTTAPIATIGPAMRDGGRRGEPEMASTEFPEHLGERTDGFPEDWSFPTGVDDITAGIDIRSDVLATQSTVPKELRAEAQREHVNGSTRQRQGDVVTKRPEDDARRRNATNSDTDDDATAAANFSTTA